MNIAFWVLVLAALVFLWFSLAPRFRAIGGELVDMAKGAKDAMSEENEEKEKEEEK